MSGKIFISYRHEDSSAWTGRLGDKLSMRFAQSQIWMDIDTLKPGASLVEAIEQNVGASNVMVAVIGKQWLSRLGSPGDYVRQEIAVALQRGIQVIPVLVEGASMPRPNELPDELKPLARRRALNVSYEQFQADSERLIVAVEEVLWGTGARFEWPLLGWGWKEPKQLQGEQREEERLESQHHEEEGRQQSRAEQEQREAQNRQEGGRSASYDGEPKGFSFPGVFSTICRLLSSLGGVVVISSQFPTRSPWGVVTLALGAAAVAWSEWLIHRRVAK